MKRIEKLRKASKVSVVHERTAEEREPRRLKKFIFALVLLLFSGLLYLLFFSEAFKIKDIEVFGYSNPKIIEGIIESACQQNFYGYNIFLFDTNSLEKTIKEDSGVTSVKAKKILPQTIRVEANEATAVVIWRTRGENYGIDDRGYVISKNINSELPLITDSLNIEVALGERVASPTFIKFVKDATSNFETIVGVGYREIIIYDILSDVRIKSADSWTVYLDASRDPISQLENLVRVLAEAREKGNTNLKYIDMRLPDRVFYK